MLDFADRPSQIRQLRRRVGPAINRFVEAAGEPTTQVYPEGYVGTAQVGIDPLEDALSAAGFSWDPLSMYHYTPAGSSTDGSWAFRDGYLADRQLHVILFELADDRTDVYAHEEYNWLRHPRKHLQEVAVRRPPAVDTMRAWLNDRGVEYERDSYVRRKLRHAIGRVRERVQGAPPKAP
jgi:hypothetical protein